MAIVPVVLLGATRGAVVRAEDGAAGWRAERVLEGRDVRCLAHDPSEPRIAYAGTQGEGLFRSHDYGRTWVQVGPRDAIVKAVAPSPHTRGLVWIGTKPAEVVAGHDHGERWERISPFPRRRSWFWLTPAERPPTQPYVLGLAESPTKPGVLVAGIEAGAVVVSEDAGRTWSGHRSGASRDCHTLAFHPRDGAWAYEGGGTGPAVSTDGARTWEKRLAGLDRRYCWAVAADPDRPEIWYVSAAPGAGKAHGSGSADARIFRADGDGWRALGGGLPVPLPSMPYGLAAPISGEVWAALADGTVWRSNDHGGTWQRLPIQLGTENRAFSLIPAAAADGGEAAS